MIKRFFGIVALSALVGCGGTGSNPVTGGPVVPNDNVVDPSNPNSNPALKFAFDLNNGLVVNAVDYDPAADQLVINNIPFDTSTNTYERTGTLPRGWGLYQNDERGPGRITYFATFMRSASGSVQAAAIGSGGFIGNGNSGATAQRLDTAAVALPVTGILNYSGTYSGVRELGESVAGGPDVELVDGTALATIDFDDFDVTGAVVGFIQNRRVYDATTLAQVGTLSDVSLAISTANRTNGTIDSSTAVALDGSLSGSWEGVFSSNGGEIAAYLIVSGTNPNEVDGTTGNVETVREIGALLVRCTASTLPGGCP